MTASTLLMDPSKRDDNRTYAALGCIEDRE